MPGQRPADACSQCWVGDGGVGLACARARPCGRPLRAPLPPGRPHPGPAMRRREHRQGANGRGEAAGRGGCRPRARGSGSGGTLRGAAPVLAHVGSPVPSRPPDRSTPLKRPRAAETENHRTPARPLERRKRQIRSEQDRQVQRPASAGAAQRVVGADPSLRTGAPGGTDGARPCAPAARDPPWAFTVSGDLSRVLPQTREGRKRRWVGAGAGRTCWTQMSFSRNSNQQTNSAEFPAV